MKKSNAVAATTSLLYLKEYYCQVCRRYSSLWARFLRLPNHCLTV